MTPTQFACPHCSGRFAIDDPPPGHPIECPHCHNLMAPEPSALLLADESAPVEVPRIELDREQEPSARHRGLGGADHDRRRMWRHAVLMTGGIVILTIAAALLSRL